MISRCLVVDPIEINDVANVFNCPVAGRATDSVMAQF